MKKNIACIQVEELGGRRRQVATGEPGYDNSGWKNKSFRAFDIIKAKFLLSFDIM